MKISLFKMMCTAKNVVLLALTTIFATSPSLGQEIIVDNRDDNTIQVGSWYGSVGANPYLGSSLYSNSQYGLFTWEADVPEVGDYDIYAWWTYRPGRSDNVPYYIDIGAPAPRVEVRANQRLPSLGGQWILLGRFSLDTSVAITVSSENGQASADAVRIVRAEEQVFEPWPERSCPCDEYYSRAIDLYVAWGGSLIPEGFANGAAIVSCETTEHALVRFRTPVNGGTADQASLLLFSAVDEPGVRYECGAILDSSLHPRNRIQSRSVTSSTGEWSDACMASVLDFCPE